MDKENKYKAWDINKKKMFYDGDLYHPHEKDEWLLRNMVYPCTITSHGILFTRKVPKAYENDYVELTKDGHHQTYYSSWEYEQLCSKDIELLEYTGLHDRIVRKDGSKAKEIYRCDIIKALNRNYDCEDNKGKYFQLFEVTYLNGCYMFGNWNAHEFFNKFIYIEDLGSKFENPKLLQK
jgi:hypothetical protein